MCPFCIGAAAWAVTGAVSAGGLGVLAAVVRHGGTDDASREPASDGGPANEPESARQG